jgi:hypothetical protein
VLVASREALEAAPVRHDIVFGHGGECAQAQRATAEEPNSVLVDQLQFAPCIEQGLAEVMQIRTKATYGWWSYTF